MASSTTRAVEPLSARLAGREARDIDRSITLPRLAASRAELQRSSEICAAAVGLLVTRLAADHEATRVDARAIDSALAILTDDLDAETMMQLEIEAWEIVAWFSGPAAPRPENARVAEKRDRSVFYDPRATTEELVFEAIAQGFDLRIDYYSRRRGEMNTRTITPIEVRAEIYLKAYCHHRKAERIFRLNRVTRCIPEGGVERPSEGAPRSKPSRTHSLAETRDRDRQSGQLSLLED